MKTIARNESGRTSKPGRNAKGHYQRDDRNMVDVLTSLSAAISDALLCLERPMDAGSQAIVLHDAREHLANVAAILSMIDVGTKPKGGDHA